MTPRTALLAAIVCLIALAMIGPVLAADTTTDHTITATGTGSVIGTPDRAQISLAVQTEAADVKDAQAQNALIMTKVMDSLTGCRYPERGPQDYGIHHLAGIRGYQDRVRAESQVLPGGQIPLPSRSTMYRGWAK